MQNITEAGQTPSDTSPNNFINFCIDKGSLTNGTQITNGSCNPIPMGQIPGVDKMPATKFQQPQNFGTIPANKDFTIQLGVKNMQMGNFVNADANYFSAPTKLSADGQVVGHTHVVVQKVDSLSSTQVLNTANFTFFKGLNAALDQDGTISTNVTGGVPAGVYRLSSITTGANHQMPNGPVAQRGAMDDAIYVSRLPKTAIDLIRGTLPSQFTATDDGNAAGGNGKSNNTKNNTGAKGNGQGTTGNTNANGNGQGTTGNSTANGNGQGTTGNTNANGNGQNSKNNASGNGQNSKDNANGNGQNSKVNANGNGQNSKDNANGNSKDNSQGSSGDASCTVDNSASNLTTSSGDNKSSKSGSSDNGSN